MQIHIEEVTLQNIFDKKHFMEQIEEYLKMYFKIDEDNLHSVAELFDLSTLRAGQSILRTGQYCNSMVFIKNGFLRIFALNDGKEITQWIATEGHFTTDLNSFLLNQPARWNIEAIIDTEIYSISKVNYNKITSIIPNWAELEKKFIVDCFTTMENRIFQFISLNTEERYSSFFSNNKTLFNQVPLQYLASMLGMTPETLSRIRKRNT